MLQVSSYQTTDVASKFFADAFTTTTLFRCESCNKLLAKGNQAGFLAGEIKCPRCGAINEK